LEMHKWMSIAILAVLCCSSMAHADSLLDALNGSFSGGGSSSFGSGFMEWPYQQGGVGTISWTGTGDVVTTQFCYDDPCTAGYWETDGTFTGGTVIIDVNGVFGHGEMTGVITGGGFSHIRNFQPGPCDPCSGETTSFELAGNWLGEGWHTTASLWLNHADRGGYGELTMATPAPEPGTLASLGGSTLALFGFLRSSSPKTLPNSYRTKRSRIDFRGLLLPP
jgi:hypothetical protein